MLQMAWKMGTARNQKNPKQKNKISKQFPTRKKKIGDSMYSFDGDIYYLGEL